MELDKLIEQYGNIDTFYYDEDGFLLYSCDDEDGIQQLNETHVKLLDFDNQKVEEWESKCIELLKEKGFDCDLYSIDAFYDMFLSSFYSGNESTLFMDNIEQKNLYEQIKKYENDVKNNPSDKKIILESLSVCEYVLGYISDSLKKDRNFAKEVVKLSTMGITFLDPSFQDDKDLALEAVQHDGLSLISFSENIKNDLDVAICALKNNDKAYEFIGDKLKNDNTFLSKAEEENIDLESIKEDSENSFNFFDQLYNNID